MSKFPEKSSERRVLVVLPEHEYEKLLNYDPNELMHKPQVNVIRYEDITEGKLIHPVIQKLENQGLLAPGKVLIQDPFSTEIYYEHSEALSQIALRKHFHLSVICQKLGAKSLRVTQVDVVSEKEKTSGNINVIKNLVNASTTYEKQIEEKLRKEMKLSEEWSGGESDVEDAYEYLKKYCLDGDINLQSLVEMFRNNGNKLIKRKLTLNVSSEANRNLKICANIGLDVIASLESAFNKEYVISQDIKLEIEVDF